MNIENKKIYIVNKLNDNKYHDKIINFIVSKNLKYSENNNYILVNLSVLNDDIVNELYDILNSEDIFDIVDNYKINIDIDEKSDENISEKNDYNNHKGKKDIIINDILLNSFTNDEKKIILKSKKYKFD